MGDRMLACCARDATSHERLQPCSDELRDASQRRSAHAVAPNWQQLLLSRLLRAYRQRTVTHVWCMSMACTGPCLGERGLVAVDQRTDPKQKEPRRAHLPALLRRSCRLRKSRQNDDAEGLAPAERRKRSPLGFGVCNGPWAHAVHSPFRFRLPCDAEPAREPSTDLCCFFRISKDSQWSSPNWRSNTSIGLWVPR